MSYLDFFGVVEPPFSTSPDPRFIYDATQYKRAVHKISNAIGEGRGLVLVHGDIGLGKTTIARMLFNQLHKQDGHHVSSLIRSNYDSPLELLVSIASGFNIADESNDISSLHNGIEQFLLSAKLDNKHAVLFLDDAHLLPQDQFETLRTLLNYEADSYKLLQIVLFAQEEVHDVIEELNAFKDRIATYVPLKPLDTTDTENLIEHRWHIAGGTELPFAEDALEALCLYAGGRPRKICALAHESLQNAHLDGANIVTRSHVNLAAEESGIPIIQTNEQPIPLINLEEADHFDSQTASDTPIFTEDTPLVTMIDVPQRSQEITI